MTLLTTILISTSAQFGLPSNLLTSICSVESSLNPAAIHRDDGGTDSIGLCQIKMRTAVWMGFRGTEAGLLNPYINSYYAAKYLKYQLLRYNGNAVSAIIAYNRGNSNGLQSTEYSDKVIAKWRQINDVR